MQTTDYQRVNGGGDKTIHPNWKEFVLGEEFAIESTSSSIDKNKLQEGEQNFPYITRTDNNNGIDHFVPEQNYALDEGNVITIGLDTQTVFYQPAAFYTGQNIQVIRHKQLNKYNALFIRVALQRVLSRFSWGSYGATLTRLRKSRIYLPATNDGKTDFDFMATFMRQVEKDILTATIPLLQHRLDTAKSMGGGVKINELQWNEFNLDDLFTISSGVRLTVADMLKGNIPFIGASDSNNGITAWVSNNNASLDQNVLGVNYNGSVCETFFHPYKCLFSDDVKRLHCKQSIPHTATKYIYLFLKQAILQQKSKYAYGYKFNAQRMKRQTLLLPVTADGTPDWQFMESYMRNLESQQIAQYLSHKLKTT
ncbi:MAG: restriction endonuclease subunit S [Paludibacteraceae bacterium]